MYKFVVPLMVFWIFGGVILPDSCAEVVADLKLPKKMKTRGKPKVCKWEDVDEMLSELSERFNGTDCKLTFGEIFRHKDEDVYFPLTNSAVRIAPEEAFTGLTVFTKEGFELGPYAGRVRYERSGGLYARKSYQLYYFQYNDSAGKMQSVGNRLLLDEFVVKWPGLLDRVAVRSGEAMEDSETN
jgi:hypothetical protein